MSQDSAVAEARRLQGIMTRRGVQCTVELMAGRTWSGDPWYSQKFLPMNHHTAGGLGSTPSYALCRNGRSDLPGPLCNGYGGRDHVYRIITLGLANHPGVGGPLTVAGFTIPKDGARISTWGTEWEHDGRSSWPQDMQDFMGAANAALLEWLAVPLGRSIEHSTWATPKGRKIDRNGYDAARGQAEIAPFLTPQEDDMSAKAEEQIADLHRLLTEQVDTFGPQKTPDGKPYRTDWRRHSLGGVADSLLARAAGERLVAEFAALRASVAALASNPNLTPEQVTEASRAGAEAALDAKISDARVEIAPKDPA